MRRKRLAAKALSVIMAISACLPMNSYTLAAYAAEKEDAVAVQEAENTESGGTQEAAMATEEEPSEEDSSAEETAEVIEETAPEEDPAVSADNGEAKREEEKVSVQEEPEQEGSQPSEEEPAAAEEAFTGEQGKEKQKELSEEEEDFLVTITLDANGGYFDEDESQTTVNAEVYIMDDYCDLSDYAERLTAPEGKEFDGWSPEKGSDEGVYEIDTTFLKEGEVYYAVWKDRCMITFDANGGYFDGQEGNVAKTVEVDPYDSYYYLYEISEAVTAPEGKTLKGWSKDKETNVQEEYLYTEELTDGDTYYAVWEDALIITFDANGGYFDGQKDSTAKKIEIDREDYYRNLGDITSSITAPAGKALKGWSPDKEAKTGVTSLYTEELSPGDIYYAVWGDAYTITLDANGGYFNGDPNMTTVQVTAASGEGVYFPDQFESASKEGKKLTGWSTDQNAAGGSNSATVTANETYYAVWADICIVTLDPNGGEFYDADADESLGNEPVRIETAKGEEYYVRNKVRREGYYFVDWYRKDSGKRHLYTDKIYKDTELIAKWVKAYKVTFDPNGGFYDDGATKDEYYPFWVDAGVKYVMEGNTPYISEWNYPKHEEGEDGSSLSVIGWSTVKGGEPVDLSEYPITQDTTFYAVWGSGSGSGSEETCSVTFDANGGTFYGDETMEIGIPKNDKFSWNDKPQNEDTSLAFGYWYLLEDGKEVRVDTDYVVTKDITVYAKWVDACRITIQAGDGYIRRSPVEGYVRTLMIPEAKGTVNLFNDGDWQPEDARIDYGSGRYIPGLFDGLYEDQAFTKEIDPRNYTVSGDATLYIKFKPYYVVTFHGNGGMFEGKYRGSAGVREETVQLISIPGSDSMQLIGDHYISGYFGYMQKKYNEPGSFLVKSGEIFSGWYLDAECTKYAGYYQDLSVDADMDLYAGYETKLCTVKLDAGAGTIETGADTFAVNESGLIAPAWEAVEPKAPSGKVFSGWYLSKDCAADQRIDDVASHLFTKDTTLYAGYADAKDVVTVRFDPNGGEYEDYYDTLNLTVLKGSTIGAVKEPANSKEMAFTGWYKDQACTQPIEDISQFRPSGDCTLYAGWAQKVKVTIVERGSTWTEYVRKNETIRSINGSYISEYDYAEGKEFVSGYSLNKDLSGKIYSIKEVLRLPISKETTFYAVYSSAKKVTLRCFVNKQDEITHKTIYMADPTLGDYSYENNTQEFKDFLNAVVYRCRVNGKVFEGVYTDSKMGEDSRLKDPDSYAVEKDITLYVNFAQGVSVKLVANGGYFADSAVSLYHLAHEDSYTHAEWYSTTADKAAVSNLTVCKGSAIDPDNSIHVYHEDGLVLMGWYYDRACTKPATKDLSTFVVNSGTILYAKWGKEGESEATEISSCEIAVSSASYTGKALTPAVKVTDGDKVLSEDTDYKISFKDNINAGKGTVIVEGIGNYTGTVEKEFTINKAAQKLTAKAAAAAISVGKTTALSVTGAEGKTTWTSSNKALATVTGSTVKGVKVGTVKFTVTAEETENYKVATAEVTVKIVPAATTKLTAANQAKGIKLTWAKVAGANGYIIYRNSKKIKTITSGSTVTFTDAAANTNGAKYIYKVVAKATTGASKLSKSITTYRVARPAITALKNAASRKMTVKWGKNAKASGYQIQYSLKSNFAGAKTLTAAKAGTVSKVIGSLTKGKVYYVRVRTYKTVGKTKFYSLWSVTKKVRISK